MRKNKKMINNSFFSKIFHPQEDEKAFSLIMKIIIICVLLSILLLAIIIYSKNLSNENQTNASKTGNIVNSNEEPTITHEELVANYKINMTKALEGFNGDSSRLKDKILEFDVPIEFQKLHFTLAISLDKVIYNGDKDSAKVEIVSLIKENSWLEQGLNKLANNL